jgi:membrane-bound serine protease (ClpP class)
MKINSLFYYFFLVCTLFFFTQNAFTNDESIKTLQPPQNNLESLLSEHVKYNPSSPNYVGLITIGDHTSEINQSTWLYVKNALEHYKKSQPIFIILELNTSGGEVFSAQKISDALKEMDTQYNIPIIAFINNWAISAGAMLAYSCRFIMVAKDASMGAAEPLTAEGGKMETASEKVNSAIRADFANRANFFGRNPFIAEAMVDKDIILVQRQGKIIKLDAENQIKTEGTTPDVLIKAKGKLLTLTAEQMMSYGVANLMLAPSKLNSITPEELKKGQWPGSKMLLFTYPFFAKIPQVTIEAYQMDWKTQFFALLANPAISSLLFLGMLLGFYVEFTTPGFGLPGTVAVTCLFLIILSSFALEIAGWLELILLLTGLLIILVELFVLPTFGLLGVIGAVFFMIGLLGMMLPGADSISYEFDTRTLNASGEVFFKRLAWLSASLLVGVSIIAVMARYITPKFAAFSKFVLVGHEQEGYIANDKPNELPQPGTKGKAMTNLRPAGKVIIEDNIYDAISYGVYIEKNTIIIVEKLDGSTIVVNKVTS